ncbi:hypothetical protein PHYBLDRAFT_145975 [Phycomyces blakesleeanus NRRL 1555(-)]|uniref:Uncharacterized protein n=1 Tax=Phycomyces blakesleeanus (strain ATCC 8743b / DSM 1359 / FGSC 10004 / NBRC 33097 / NRRL 1555) TaxID=763407 RepID=A0A167MEY7_PHYB8|nr:hypothetical protein PHYBLDRAFT_145975 [Phycomyces blakesleeanus NRRL 1555(-)]OAD72659.1 hypothetical protein PHYBLDRAFT_145975 [Phycomyces blakesleeanus NRRL 1555(-)]|eukprot:XP_018290699.1 hypothetical protein PHYBLDRAFT_145975 [Phycomyces blakesleeanus NRRL 1555(-)]
MKAGQDTIKLELNSIREELNSKIDYLQSQLDNRGFSEQETVPSATDIPCNSFIHAPILNTWDITLKHVFKMMSKDFGIEINNEEKATLRVCTKIICDKLAVHSLIKDLDSSPSWESIPVIVRKQMCAKHATLMKDASIDLIRCHENWVFTSRISHLWRDHFRRLQSRKPLMNPGERHQENFDKKTLSQFEIEERVQELLPKELVNDYKKNWHVPHIPEEQRLKNTPA